MEIRADAALEWKPEFIASSDTLFGMSDKAKFRREIYCLEFSFKPLRMIEVDVPLASGSDRAQAGLVPGLPRSQHGPGAQAGRRQRRRLLHRNRQGRPGPVLPQFVLESQDRQATGGRVSKSYLDRVIPAAVAAISQRETPGRMLLNSVEISKQPIPVSDGRIDRSVWGVATWVDVDPRIDFFSVYVGGLTNAYQLDRYTRPPTKPGDTPGRGRQFVHKMLQLNFWRPGDELMPNEREFRYGVPLDKADLYDVGDGVAYRWVYR